MPLVGLAVGGAQDDLGAVGGLLGAGAGRARAPTRGARPPSSTIGPRRGMDIQLFLCALVVESTKKPYRIAHPTRSHYQDEALV